MANTVFRGPIVSMGANDQQSGTASAPQPLDGPSMFYQGVGMLDAQGGAFPVDNDLVPGRVPMILGGTDWWGIDVVPQTQSQSVVAASQTLLTAGFQMALATVAVTNFSAGAASIGYGIPFIPAGTTTVTTVPITIDFGFTTGTTIANSTTVSVPDNTKFELGQWIVIGGVGNTAGTQALITQVTSIAAVTGTLYVSPNPATALGAPIGNANLWGSQFLPPATQFGPGPVSASADAKAFQAGFARVANPREFSARGLQFVANSSTGGTCSILVTGWDVYKKPMAELLTGSGTTVVFGKKAFKYIAAATVQSTFAGGATYTLGISDVLGLPYRADEAQQLTAWAGHTAIANDVGFVAAVTTPATNTTGDVRGTIQMSAIGGGTVISSAATSNNVLRWTVVHGPEPWAVCKTTPINLTLLYGTAQAPS